MLIWVIRTRQYEIPGCEVKSSSTKHWYFIQIRFSASITHWPKTVGQRSMANQPKLATVRFSPTYDPCQIFAMIQNHHPKCRVSRPTGDLNGQSCKQVGGIDTADESSRHAPRCRMLAYIGWVFRRNYFDFCRLCRDRFSRSDSEFVIKNSHRATITAEIAGVRLLPVL